MAQISASPSTKKISDLIGMIKRGELILQPAFQRKLVWNPKHKEAFIDTILKGFPFPEIYISQRGIDLETLKTEQVVVDGQQRLSTIMNYIEGAISCKNIHAFKDLDEDQQKEFLAYDVVVRDLKDASEETIKEIFKRINQTSYSLSDIEIDNAVYEGEFISTAKEILDELSKEDIPIFSDREISRMADLDYILMMMSTLEENGYFASNKLTETYIIKYDETYPNAKVMKNTMMETFDNIKNLDLPSDSIWYRKSNFFTLFIEIAKSKKWYPDMKTRLMKFEKNILDNKDEKECEFGRYYAAMYTGTNSRTARITRAELFNKYCMN